MERIQAAQIATRLAMGRQEESSAISLHREKQRLDGAELEQFNLLMEQMWAYYPHQEFLQETVDGFEFDMERLALRFGMLPLREVLLGLRLREGQKFFPHPTEVLEELEAMATKAQQVAHAANPYADGVSSVVAAAPTSPRDRAAVRAEAYARAHAPNQNLRVEAFANSRVPDHYNFGKASSTRQARVDDSSTSR